MLCIMICCSSAGIPSIANIFPNRSSTSSSLKTSAALIFILRL